MEYKTISTNDGKILAKLEEGGREWFSVGDLYELYPEEKPQNIRVQISRMVEKGLVTRLYKDLYYVVPLNQDAGNYLPDWHLLAEPLTRGSSFYIGYYSALQVHGLITQPSLKEQIVWDYGKSKSIDIKGVEFQIISHNKKHFFGQKKIWIDSFYKVVCSDLEKTVIDCLFKPEYAGSIIECAKAIWMAREKIDYRKLLQYAVRFDCQAVIKRLGYILELLEIGGGIIPELYALRTATISPLDTESPNEGRISTRWSLRVNVENETILSAINN